jgi:hypothetical protein
MLSLPSSNPTLKNTGCITPKQKSLQEGTEFLWRLNFQNPWKAQFHVRLREVRVITKADRKIECYGILAENRLLWGRCPELLSD